MKRKLVSVTEGHPEAKEGLDKGVPGVVIRWLRELTASNAAVVWLSLPYKPALRNAFPLLI